MPVTGYHHEPLSSLVPRESYRDFAALKMPVTVWNCRLCSRIAEFPSVPLPSLVPREDKLILGRSFRDFAALNSEHYVFRNVTSFQLRTEENRYPSYFTPKNFFRFTHTIKASGISRARQK